MHPIFNNFFLFNDTNEGWDDADCGTTEATWNSEVAAADVDSKDDSTGGIDCYDSNKAFWQLKISDTYWYGWFS